MLLNKYNEKNQHLNKVTDNLEEKYQKLLDKANKVTDKLRNLK